MKKLSLIILVLCFSHMSVSSQSCLPEGIVFLTQSQVDSFQILYPNCTRIEGPLYIGMYSPVLSNVSNLSGLSTITYVGALNIKYSNYLTSLSGLNNIDTIGGYFSIAGSYNITSLADLENLKHIGGSLHIGSRILNPLGGWMAVGTNLESLTGLENIHSIGGNLEIRGNNSLSSISEFNNVKSIEGGIYIWRNDSLSSLIGLANIDASSIDTISISENASLSECEVNSICDYILNPITIPHITDNALGCSSIQEVEEACESASVEEPLSDGYLSLYPNPARQELNISTDDGRKVDEAHIYTLTGQQVMKSRPENGTVDISHLQPGMYIVEVIIENTRIRRKLLVE